MKWIRAYADLRERDPASDRGYFLGLLGGAPIDLPMRRATAELVQITQEISILVEMQVKHYCRTPRPAEMSDKVHPVIDTPDHSTFPSGHATEAFAIATVLHRLEHGTALAPGMGPPPAQVFLLAHRIAVNRTVAGVHFPVDSAAGAAPGFAIGEAIAALATGVTIKDYGFAPNGDPEADFLRSSLAGIAAGKQDAVGIVPEPLLKQQWNHALKEWSNRDGTWLDGGAAGHEHLERLGTGQQPGPQPLRELDLVPGYGACGATGWQPALHVTGCAKFCR